MRNIYSFLWNNCVKHALTWGLRIPINMNVNSFQTTMKPECPRHVECPGPALDTVKILFTVIYCWAQESDRIQGPIVQMLSLTFKVMAAMERFYKEFTKNK